MIQKVHCVKSEWGWCACAENAPPPKVATSVPTLCKLFGTLPLAFEERAPTCYICLVLLRRKQREARETIVATWNTKIWTDPDQIGIVRDNDEAVFQTEGNFGTKVWNLIEAIVEAHNDEIPGFGIYSFGTTPEDAIRALGGKIGWGEIVMGKPLEGNDEAFDWGFRFTADGTSMKAGGHFVTGGTILTWWK